MYYCVCWLASACFVFVLFTSPIECAANIPDAEMSALADLYNSTQGKYWGYPDSSLGSAWDFSGSANPCLDNWYGIRCMENDGIRHVTHLNLNNCSLLGSLPHTLDNLQLLQELTLTYNNITGTLPSSLGNLANLSSLYLDTNKLSGPIPNSFGKLLELRRLGISYNWLSQALPSTLDNLQNLFRVELDENYLSGPLPDCLWNLTDLAVLYLYNNLFTGTISSDIVNLKKLYGVYLSSNQLSGTIPENIGAMAAELTYLYFDSNSLHGIIPESIGELVNLEALFLSQNSFSGKLPTFFSSFAGMYAVNLQNNRFSGSLDGIFNTTLQKELSSIQLNNNLFTGTLPGDLFSAPLLTLFSAVGNCFNGPLPVDAICQSSSLSSLLLDGLGSARSCNAALLPKEFSSSYQAHRRITGGIATYACLFGMNLQVLHLSGNGLTGSLPHDLVVSRSLFNLALSYNSLTGSIPAAIQKQTWRSLDLAYNRFSGTLIPDFATIPILSENYTHSPVFMNASNITGSKLPLVIVSFIEKDVNSTSVYMENNRISGTVPQYLQNLQHVSILGSNVFSCDISGDGGLPQHDKELDNYQCGSDSFNEPYYAWMILVALTAVFVGVVLYKSAREVSGFVSEVNTCTSRLLEKIAEIGLQCPGLETIFQMIAILSTVSVRCLAYVVVVLLPFYCASNSTLTHRYGWVTSAAFLSGKATAAVEMVLLLGLAALFLYSFFVYLHAEPLHTSFMMAPIGPRCNAAGISSIARLSSRLSRRLSKLNPTNLHQRVSATKLFVYYCSFAVLNAVLVVGVNIAFVYVAIYQSSGLLIFAQVMLSLFKLLWNGFCFKLVTRYFAGIIDSTAENIPERRRDLVSLQVFTALFNNIVIPCLVVGFVSPNCYYNVFVPAPTVSSTYIVSTCFAISPDGSCTVYIPKISVTSFSPPFSYSYQCSSSLITYYSPAFVNLCIMSTFVSPMLQCALRYIHRRAISRASRWWPQRERVIDALERYIPSELVILNYNLKDAQEPTPGVADAAASSRLGDGMPPETQSAPEENGGAVPWHVLQQKQQEQAEEQNRMRREKKREASDEELFDPSVAVVTVITYLGILLTFGAVFPPLAVAVTVAILVIAWIGKASLSLLMLNVVSKFPERARLFERSCVYVGNDVVLLRSMHMLVTACCLFYTLFLFDTLGDETGFHGAFWVLIVVPMLPSMVYAAHYCYDLYLKRSSTCPVEHAPSAASQRDRTADQGGVLKISGFISNNTAKLDVAVEMEMHSNPIHRHVNEV
jgi:Leucine-rich repeat (LRR) protein